MSVPWLGIQKIAVVPTFNTQFDGPAPSDWDYLVMRRVQYDPDPFTGADRSLRAYINALSYGQAVLDAKLFPHAFSDGPSVIEAAWQSLPSGHGYPYVLCVIPWADGDSNRIGFFEGVGHNGVVAVARVAMYDILTIKRRQLTGVWAMEVLHAMVGWPDLYKAHGANMDDWDNMTYNAGTHSCAHLKLHPGWLAASDVADHPGRQHDYNLQSLSAMTPPPGRFAAVRIRATTGNVFMAEARLKSDTYEMGFAPLPGQVKPEFRGLPGSGVIVYQTHDDLQETLFAGGPLAVGQSYDNAAEEFSISVLDAIDEGVTIRVTGGAIEPRKSLTGVPVGAPVTAVARRPEQIDLWVVPNDGAVWSAAWNVSGWSAWFSLGSAPGGFAAGTAVAAVAREPERLDLWAVGKDGNLWSAAWSGATGWSGWFSVGAPSGGLSANTRVTAVARKPGQLDLFATAKDGKAWSAAWSEVSGWSTWFSLGSAPAGFAGGAPLAAVARDPERLDLWAVGKDGSVWSAAWDSAGWSPWFSLGAPADGFPTSAPIAVVARKPGQLDVWTVSKVGTIWSLAWSEASGWDVWFVL